jgi:hypothetical protein
MGGEEDDAEWRYLCDLAAKESDPQRVRKLLDQLIGGWTPAGSESLRRALL